MASSVAGCEPLRLTAWISALASLQLWPLSLALEGNPFRFIARMTPVDIGALMLIGIGSTAIGYSIWYGLIARHGVGKISPFLLLVPVLSILLAVVALGETLHWPVVMGGAVILAGIALTLKSRAA